MPADGVSTDRVGDRLYEAYRTGDPIAPPREGIETELSVTDAYEIQDRVVDRRRADEGGVVGYKIGFTSAAIREEFGIEEPVFGRVLEDTLRSEGRLDVATLIEPRIEAEIAFRLGSTLEPPVTTPDVLAASEAILPVIEVVDSRIRDWDVSAAEAVADNALSGRVVHADRVARPADRDLGLEGIRVRRNGETVATGVGADVLDGPANAVRWLAGTLAERADERLSAGDLVLTGSATPVVPLEVGDTVEVDFSTLGSVTVSATG